MKATAFWRGKRVLITGADGFIGSHLTERLLEMGARVSVFVRGTSRTGTTGYALKNISGLESRLEKILAGDIASGDTVDRIRRNRPQVIFHLAADAYVPYSFDHPAEVMKSNVLGTLQVLEASRNLPGLLRVVCTSSSEIYGTAKYVPIDENHPLNPTSPYAASKAAADRFAYAYKTTYRLPVTIIRPFNTYGPRHTYDVIPKFIRLALQGKRLTVHGSGRQTRDFTYVDDMVEAFLLMGSHPKAVGQTVNFGTGRETSIRDLARLIVKISGSASQIVHTPERLAQVGRLCCDFSLARRLFGWHPRVSLAEGLRRNIEWARENLS